MKLRNLSAAVIAATTLISPPAFSDLQISSGQAHTLINDNGTLLAVGSNRYLESGQSIDISNIWDETEINLPALVLDMDATSVKSIAALENGDIYIFGRRLAIDKVSNLSGATQVEVNDLGAYALIDGDVYFGWSFDGATWIKIDGLSNVTAISARGKHLLAVDINQAAYDIDASNSVTYIQGLPPVLRVEAGNSHSMFIDANNQLWAMGEDPYSYGLLGLGTKAGTPVPTMVPNGNDVIDVAAARFHTLSLKSDGTVWGAGGHNYISLTDSSIYNVSASFVHITELDGASITDVEAGMNGSFASSEDTMHSWGSGGVIGNGSLTELHRPKANYVSTFEPEVILPTIAGVQLDGSYIITGTNFGSDTGSIIMDGYSFGILSWTDGLIQLERPSVAMSGDLVVMDADGSISNAWTVALIPEPSIKHCNEADANRGHGNDCDGFDEDNPGKGKGHFKRKK